MTRMHTLLEVPGSITRDFLSDLEACRITTVEFFSRRGNGRGKLPTYQSNNCLLTVIAARTKCFFVCCSAFCVVGCQQLCGGSAGLRMIQIVLRATHFVWTCWEGEACV